MKKVLLFIIDYPLSDLVKESGVYSVSYKTYSKKEIWIQAERTLFLEKFKIFKRAKFRYKKAGNFKTWKHEYNMKLHGQKIIVNLTLTN